MTAGLAVNLTARRARLIDKKPMRKLNVIVSFAFLCLPVWAEVSAPGVPNFHQVADGIYRGGQPTSDGWKSLSRIGVKTVIDLRPDSEHSIKAEQHEVEGAGMKFVSVPLEGFGAPPADKINQLLDLLAGKSGPFFIHCRRGADRTGTVIACYRIAHDHWENQKALAEAKSCGMSWVEFAMRHYVLGFQPGAATLVR